MDETLPAEDKFQFEVGKSSRKLSPTAANYPKNIEQLKNRFGREDLLIQIYIRELLSMTMKNAISNCIRTDLVALYDEIESKLRASDSLGCTQEKYGDFSAPLVELCLSEGSLITWERQCSSEGFGKHSLEI